MNLFFINNLKMYTKYRLPLSFPSCGHVLSPVSCLLSNLQDRRDVKVHECKQEQRLDFVSCQSETLRYQYSWHSHSQSLPHREILLQTCWQGERRGRAHHEPDGRRGQQGGGGGAGPGLLVRGYPDPSLTDNLCRKLVPI